MVVLVTCKNKEEQIKNKGVEWSQDFTLWELSVAMETRVLIRSYPKNLMQLIPYPNDAPDEI